MTCPDVGAETGHVPAWETNHLGMQRAGDTHMIDDIARPGQGQGRLPAMTSSTLFKSWAPSRPAGESGALAVAVVCMCVVPSTSILAGPDRCCLLVMQAPLHRPGLPNCHAYALALRLREVQWPDLACDPPWLRTVCCLAACSS